MPATPTPMTTTGTLAPSTGTPAPATAAALLDALAAGEASAAELAERAGIARSTATKTLAALAAADQVTRRAGGRDGGRRLPDRWSLPTATPAATPTPTLTPEAAEIPAPLPTARLASGELSALVSSYLREHPGEHSPTRIAAALGGRSAGAVGNALVRLLARGEAAQTSQAPRRYQTSAH